MWRGLRDAVAKSSVIHCRHLPLITGAAGPNLPPNESIIVVIIIIILICGCFP